MRLTLLLFFVFFINFAFAQNVPECQGYYWVMNNFVYSLDKNEPCDGEIAACNYIGSSDEGWYSYPLENKEKVLWEKCSYNQSAKPKCLYIGSKSEGWYYKDQVLSWSECANMDVVCIYSGSRSEGWYSFPAGTRSLITLEKCSDK